MTIPSLILLAVFGASIAAIYLWVRRGKLTPTQGALIGCAIDIVVLFLFSLSAGNEPLRAVVTGVVGGLVFNLLTVAAASYFRQNEIARQAQ